MERLTKYDKDGTAIAPEFADETYIMQDDHDRFTGYINSPVVDRLAELEDKLESGLIIDLTDSKFNISQAFISHEGTFGTLLLAIPIAYDKIKVLLNIGVKDYRDSCIILE